MYELNVHSKTLALIHDGNVGRSRKKSTNDDPNSDQCEHKNYKKNKLKQEATNVISKGLDLVDQFASLDGVNYVMDSETEIVDSLGQHLLLHTDNILGGGK